MATHPSTLARKIPRTEESGGLQSTGLQRVRYMTEHTCSHSHFLLGWKGDLGGILLLLFSVVFNVKCYSNACRAF